MQNIELDLDEKAVLINSLRAFILSNTPYTYSAYASRSNDLNLIAAKRLFHKVTGDFYSSPIDIR